MIFVTGDTHRVRDIEKLEPYRFPEQEMLTRSDYLVIAGDFGGLWTGDEQDDEVLEYHNNKNYTTLFVAGNHENFDLLEQYPVEEWHGGKIRRIRENVIQLMNGQIFDIDGKKIFIMGGATSIDRILRQEGISWWPQEEPPYEEYEEAVEKLKGCGYKVDYIITHTCPEAVRRFVNDLYGEAIEYESQVEKFLDLVLKNVKYRKWFTGHLHKDRELNNINMRLIFNSVIKIK